jgi:two-component sensor histidine kinase
MDAQNIKLRRGLPLRVHLVIFGLICFIPASVAVWFVGFNLARAEQRRVEGQAFRIVQDFSRAVDAEVSSLTKALQALSSSPALEMRDHARFREQAAVVARDNAATIALRELSGRHVINTLLPYGTSPMPVTADPVLTAADRRAIETRMPVSTDLYIGVTGKRPYVTVVMPVVSGGEVVALLSMAVTPERIGEKLRLGALAEEGWLAAVVGADGRVIARSRDADRFVGQPATGDLARAITVARSGSLRSVTLDGVAVFTAFQVGDGGWTTVVSVPEDVLNAPVSRLYGFLGLVASLVVAATLLGTWAYGRLLGGELTTLAENARRMSAHRPLEPFSLKVSEVAAAQQAFAEASETSDKLLRELDHRVKNTLSIVQSIAQRTVANRAEKAALSGRIAALSRAHEALSEARWDGVLLEGLLKSVCSAERIPITAEGPDVLLTARTATSLAQAWQELCSNARQHGVMATEVGTVATRWKIEDGTLLFEWREDGAQVETDYEPAFGLKIVDLCVVRQLNGAVSIAPGASGWLVRLAFPLESELGVAAKLDVVPT